MILESLINDGRKVTIDCAKATIVKGSRVTIDDIHWESAEVQGAIKLGFVAVVGDPPVLPEKQSVVDRKIRYRNTYSSKLCFECIKDYASPGDIIHIPSSKLTEPEIRNAISARWLVNVDNPSETPPLVSGPKLVLDELTVGDIMSLPSELASDLSKIMNTPRKPVEELPEGVPVKRPVKAQVKTQAQGPIKAKKISSSGENDGDESSDGLYQPSEVHVPKPKPARQREAQKPLLVEEDNDFDLDIFSKK
jgi:hypothetical protein